MLLSGIVLWISARRTDMLVMAPAQGGLFLWSRHDGHQDDISALAIGDFVEFEPAPGRINGRIARLKPPGHPDDDSRAQAVSTATPSVAGCAAAALGGAAG